MCKRFVIHPILLHIIIAIFHHGKVPLIDNHPNMASTHYSEATGWGAHWSLNENDVIDMSTLAATTIAATATTDHVY